MYRRHLEEMEKEADRLAMPDFGRGWDWFNSAPLSVPKHLKGKIVLLDFWTYCCINCIHVLPDLAELEEKYKDEPVVVIGVHSAKFTNEKLSENIRQAVLRYDISHPVVNDQQMQLWQQLGIRSWPTIVAVGPRGNVLAAFPGEGTKDEIDQFIREALDFYGEMGLLNQEPIPLSLERESSLPDSPFRFPAKLAVDPQHPRLFISDSNHHRIVVTDFEGQELAIIGSGRIGLKDGDFSTAEFNRPQGITYGEGKLYVADAENHALRVVDMESDSVRTLAGNGRQGRDYSGGSKGAEQELSTPWDVCLNGGKLYIAMAGTHQIWIYDLESGVTRAYSGSGMELNLNSEDPLKAAWAQPSGLAVGNGQLYIADSESSTIRSIDLSTGSTSTLVGGDPFQPRNLFAFGDVDGKAERARLQHPLGVAWYAEKEQVIVADTYNHRIKILHPISKEISAWIGDGSSGYQDGPAEEAKFSEPSGFALSPDQKTLFVADTNNHLIRKVDLEKMIVSTLPCNVKIP